MSRYFLYRHFSGRYNSKWFLKEGDIGVSYEEEEEKNILSIQLNTNNIIKEQEIPVIINFQNENEKDLLIEQDIIISPEQDIILSKDNENEILANELEMLNSLKQKELILDNKELLYQLLDDINKGNHILKALQYRMSTISREKAKLIDQKEGVNFLFRKDYIREANGELEYINKKMIKNQRKVIGYILKQLGQCLLSGRSIMTISLPLTVFEPLSVLERIGAAYGYAPYFLEKGGEINDSLEQFKYALAFVISSLHLQTKQEKPFDAIIGETLQGYIGECELFLEQILYEPQIARTQLYGKNFILNGTYEFMVDTSANSIKGGCLGHPKITFKNTKNIIAFQTPTALISGTAFGKRTFQYTGKTYVYDIKNAIFCEISFDVGGNDWFSKRKTTKDSFSGTIWQCTEKFLEKIKTSIAKIKEIKVPIKEKIDFIKALGKVEGTWLDYLDIDGKNYWKFEKYIPYQLTNAQKALPSDSSYRLDIIHLKLGDDAKARDLKMKIEDTQRRDAKLRAENEKKMLKIKKK